MTSIDSLADEIVKSLKEYTTEVEKDLEEVEKEVATEAVSSLKSNSPKRKGKYAKSWKQNVLKTGTKSQIVIYNSKHGQLTHLLENGHAKRGGGRVAPIVHIKPVEDKVVKDMENKTRARLQK